MKQIDEYELTDLLINIDAVVGEAEHELGTGDHGPVGQLAAPVRDGDQLVLAHKVHVSRHLDHWTGPVD